MLFIRFCNIQLHCALKIFHTIFNFFDDDANKLFLTFAVSISSGEVKSISFVDFFNTRPLLDTTKAAPKRNLFYFLFFDCLFSFFLNFSLYCSPFGVVGLSIVTTELTVFYSTLICSI